MCKCNMAQANTSDTRSDVDADDRRSVSIETWLAEVSRELDPADCEALSELGIYSIHDHDTARTMTLPKGAEEFDDATTVKQYYFEGEECPLLIVAPLQF